MKLKLATVFSGIGAIEHALDRMNIDYELIFASDNGGISIFEKKIPYTFKDINYEIDYLHNLINNLNLSEKDYYITVIDSQLDIISNNMEFLVADVTEFIDTNELNQKSKDIDIFEFIMNIKEYCETIPNKSVHTSLVKRIKAVAGELNMLHEIIGTTELKNKLELIDDYTQKKSVVDEIYKNSRKENYVKKSYFANYNISEEKFHYDVKFIDGNQYKNKVDLFVGGSPCQSFSMVGKRKGLEDTRGTLFYEYARLIKEIEPKVFIYENVKGLLSHDDGKTWQTMQEVFNDLNYSINFKLLNAKDFGIPQNRERIFVVGFRKDINLNSEFKFPQELELKTTMKDFLIDNVSGKYYLPQKGVKFVLDEKNINKRYTQIDGEIQLCQKANQQFNWHGDFVFTEENEELEKTIENLEKYFLSEKVKKYVLSSGTKNFYSKPEINLDIARPLLQSMHKMHRAGVDNYVETEGRLRKLTPRECLRLMGFCDSFKIEVSDTQMYKQSGNSIVVDVLIQILSEIFLALPLS